MKQWKSLFSLIFVAILLLTFAAGCTPKSGDATTYAIDYNVQGYLFMDRDGQRTLVEETVLSAKNETYPQKIATGDTTPNDGTFEQFSLRGFPPINNTENLNVYSREVGDGILEVVIDQSASIRDSETGKITMITAVRYVLLIQENTKDLLLCHIITELGGPVQQYYFSPSPNPDSINDVLIRAYQA